MTQAPTPVPAAMAPPAVAAARLADEQGQYLIFTLHDEAFAISILAIKEIIEYGSLTEVPMMPALVRGVINLRGAVVPVIDLMARFGRGRTGVGRRTCIVIVELEQDGERQDLGVIVDAVNEVLDIPSDDIEPAPAFGATIRSDFIAGMAKVAGRFVVILDTDKVLSLGDIEAVHAQNDGKFRTTALHK